MAISEKTVHDALVLGAEQINADGGVLGKQLEIVREDGSSELTVFAEKATKLISSDCVAAVFGGWTSSSRKAMLPVAGMSAPRPVSCRGRWARGAPSWWSSTTWTSCGRSPPRSPCCMPGRS
ncbi:MAG: transporter substrate-binding protein [Pseudonocardiaceae bacterium]